MRLECGRAPSLLSEYCRAMDPLTHVLFGATLARAGFNRKTALATPVMALAAEIPDIDVVNWIRGPVRAFAAHRGVTHSFVGVPLDAALALLIIYAIHRLRQRWRAKKGLERPAPLAATDRVPAVRPKLPASWGVLFAFACIAALSHLLLDFTNQYGLRPFLPFSYRWYHWDIVSIIEPVMLGAMLAGLIVPALFGLIRQEIGARTAHHGSGGAAFALVCIVLMWGVRDYEHRRALAALDSLEYGSQLPVRLSAFPYTINPFRWYAVVETDAAYRTMDVDSLTPAVDPERRERAFKKQDSPAIEAAKRSALGRVYLDWADYPIFQVLPLENADDADRWLRRMAYTGGSLQAEPPPAGYLVRIIDLRYFYVGRRGVLGAAVQLDRNYRVVAVYMGGRMQRVID
jgi:inner membrane protein